MMEECVSVQEFVQEFVQECMRIEEVEVSENEIGVGDVQSIGKGKGNGLLGWIVCQFWLT